MKTRIKIVEKNSGKKEYHPQSKRFFERWRNLVKFADSIGECIYKTDEKLSLGEAKLIIDQFLAEEAERKHNATKKTTYIKYP